MTHIHADGSEEFGPRPVSDQNRLIINAWIRKAGNFIDLAAAFERKTPFVNYCFQNTHHHYAHPPILYNHSPDKNIKCKGCDVPIKYDNYVEVEISRENTLSKKTTITGICTPCWNKGVRHDRKQH